MSLRALLGLEPAARPVLCGVVHLAPLPGAPGWGGSMQAVIELAARDAEALREGGAEAVVVENHGDAPFFKGAVPPETVAAMAISIEAVRAAAPELSLGVNVLRNDARAALALCAASGAGFLRVNVHTGAAVTDQGIVEGAAGETLRERARLAPQAKILADVHVKHARPLGARDIRDAAAETAGRGGADGLIVTGKATGAEADASELMLVRERLPETPLLIGSGVTPSNAPALLAHADGAIVGTWLKREGDVARPVDSERVARLREVFDAARA